jgi:hypothetical protein
MNVNRPISELADLLARRQPLNAADVLRDIVLELELLIGRHQAEEPSRALRLCDEDVELQ